MADQENIIARAGRKEVLVLFAVFHHSYLVPFFLNEGKDFVTLTADDANGDILTGMIKRLGFTAMRVPANDDPKVGARAAIRMIDALRNKHPGAIAVDGPYGPFEKVKPGIFAIAQKSGAKIYLGAFGVSRAFVFKNRWDKFRLPLPFAKVVVSCGPEFVPTLPMTDESLKQDCLRLEKTMHNMTLQADEMAKTK